MRRVLRYWPLIAVGIAVLFVAAACALVDHLTREPPNYSEIEDGLWLGGTVAAPPRGTRAVLNLCETEDKYRVESQRWTPIQDAAPAPSLNWLQKQVDFIVAEREAGNTVFVHCRNGVSRSGMVMAAYLMRREGWSRDQALDYLRARRPGVRPNPVFMQLLAEWEGT